MNNAQYRHKIVALAEQQLALAKADRLLQTVVRAEQQIEQAKVERYYARTNSQAVRAMNKETHWERVLRHANGELMAL